MQTASDPFGTAGVRGNVLAAWAASPARFREDANAEEDLVRGGYRDRLLVELAQNAADAAVRAGMSGRLRLVLEDDVLRAANTGAHLDADGVGGVLGELDQQPVAVPTADQVLLGVGVLAEAGGRRCPRREHVPADAGRAEGVARGLHGPRP